MAWVLVSKQKITYKGKFSELKDKKHVTAYLLLVKANTNNQKKLLPICYVNI